VGFALAVLDPPEMIGAENLHVWNISQRIGWVYNTVLLLVGVNATGFNTKMASSLMQYEIGRQIVSTDIRWKLAEALYWYIIPVMRLGLAIFILDTWQYFWHRAMHQVPYLYRTLHSRHHRLYVPYAFGALYNHPIEGLILDTSGAGLAYLLSGMSLKGSIVFFGLSTIKTVDDHCGYKLPFDPLQLIFHNNAEYHDIHHQGWGVKVCEKITKINSFKLTITRTTFHNHS